MARIAVSGFLLLSLLCALSVSYADQNASQLSGLFEDLKDASEPSEARRIEAAIWQHWLTPPDDEASQLMVKISKAMEASDLAVALRLNDQLVESHPAYAEAWNRRATLHYMLGNNAESVADIRETIALEPRHFGAISGLGLIFVRNQNFEAALEAFEKVLAISPASLNAQRSIERVRQELGREI